MEEDKRPVLSTGTQEESAWDIFIKAGRSIRYALESALGKYSLKSYLSVLSQFTDSEILKARSEGLRYCGGKAVFRAERDSDFVSAAVSLYFRDASETVTEKTARQHLEKSMFTTDSLMEMESADVMEFQIEEPAAEVTA